MSNTTPAPLAAVKGLFLLLVFLVIFSVPEPARQTTNQP
jgi:hypothetical protein